MRDGGRQRRWNLAEARPETAGFSLTRVENPRRLIVSLRPHSSDHGWLKLFPLSVIVLLIRLGHQVFSQCDPVLSQLDP